MAALSEYLLWKSDYCSKSSILEHTLRSLSNRKAEVTLFCPRRYLLSLFGIRAHAGSAPGTAGNLLTYPKPSLGPCSHLGACSGQCPLINDVILKLGGKGCLGPRLTPEGVRVRMA